jgi:Domain of unknown function (DUF4440)
MKKHLPLLFVALLLSISMCYAQTSRKAKGNATGQGSLEKALVAKEIALWEGWKNKNTAAFEKGLSADAVMVGDTGVETKALLMKDISIMPCEIKGYALSDFKVTMINSASAILTFKATQDYTCHGEAGPSPVYGSSVYVKRGGQWLNIFHQETPENKQAGN